MKQLGKFVLVLVVTIAEASPALPDRINDLYRSQAIVTGQGEKNRQAGFRTVSSRFSFEFRAINA